MTQQECTVYKCGFCRKKYLVKHACEKHEKYCPKNPNNWHVCWDCPHLETGRVETEGGYMEPGPTFKTFRCTKLEKDLHSYVAERIGHSCIGDTERMPLFCPDHPDAIAISKKVSSVLSGEPMHTFDDYFNHPDFSKDL
jgi:hypothetical protein